MQKCVSMEVQQREAARVAWLFVWTAENELRTDPRPRLVLPLSIERAESGQLEDGVIALLLELVAPVPSARQTTVDARTGVEEVVCTAAIESVSATATRTDEETSEQEARARETVSHAHSRSFPSF